jgi:ComF family protein
MLRAPLIVVARLLWPARCASCDGFVPEHCSFCEPCAEGLLPVGDPCPGCALPGRGPGRCARCRQEPPPFEGAQAVFLYGDVVSQALLRYKHGGRLDLARPLGRLLAPFLRGGADAILPVPLHPRRLRTRGFNQALELVRACDRRRRAPLWVDVLRRRRDTPSLGHLSAQARRDLVMDAFVVPDPRRVAGRQLLLVDDVMTTGATLTACAAALRQAGAAQVHVLALARAI